MAIKPAYANVELNDGTIHEDVRVTFSDRLRFEKTAKARHWTPEHQAYTTGGFLAYAALTRTGQFTGSFDEFLAAVLDVQLDDVTADTDEESSDPTRPDHSDEL